MARWGNIPAQAAAAADRVARHGQLIQPLICRPLLFNT